MGRMLTIVAIFFLFTGAWWDRQDETPQQTKKAMPVKQSTYQANQAAMSAGGAASDLPTPETIAMIQSMDSEFFKQMISDDPEETRRRFETLAQMGRIANQMKANQ
ncbi:MAG: hypothetical protein COV74_03115 [Candidatus Omnitrophica bacterium CG11_big_fil_rev_8_21_14_0_20_45_26]|uniref:Uncharacterized protein n=1 Tax=Candidatus Abzuiibacterium crystallinum TaxID=1974748 RepID=A0A2H0LTL1_9BACT|nr:MAG: hypothetical protein COV74_03115 [Candidatus Omnitrophica bacterium CG11_big_fil_rev_8_21_14_0_20_45_26]PIW64665.1 MAG: hypothetical protein COW12_05140 [Candidatus Omnitrophica bacterium CG12_big_fil_rev_8_21_14_0_65_45_16]